MRLGYGQLLGHVHWLPLRIQ